MLGRAYLNLDAHIVEAMDELDTVWQRRGEGFAAFLDDTPTYQRLVEVPYWLGRSQEALGMKQAAMENYQDFLGRRDLAGGDPLVEDASLRVRALEASSAD